MDIIIAEKPRVAMKIASAIGKSEKIIYNKRVAYYKINNTLVIPSVGHIFSLSTNDKGYPTFNIEWKRLDDIDKKYQYVKPYIDNFIDKKDEAERIIVATDFDNEGSLIGYNIARFIFPSLEIKRMKFSALTKNDLKKAYENLMDFDYGNAIAGETRHIVDWFYGINISRALMASLKTAGKYKILSIGRVQGPTLALAVSRENEIENFKPEIFYILKIKAKNTEFLYEKKVKEKEIAEKIFQEIGEDALVERVEKQEVKIKQPYPFDLTTLQIDAYKIFRISPSKTLQIAQILYENSLISYPRTSSQQLPPSINYRAILKMLSDHEKDYSTFSEKLLNEEKLFPAQGKKTDPAHPAIYPTGQKPEDIKEEERKIYELIVKRFIATFMKPAIKVETKVKLNAKGYQFFAEGLKIKESNWLLVLKGLYEIKEKEIADFYEGEVVKIQKKEIKKEKTKPPSRYNEASLVKEMEKRSLGTKATRAVIVSTLFLRSYFYKEKNGIHVSDLGKAVYKTLATYVPEILSESLTREMEKDLEGIAIDISKQKEVLEKAKKIVKNVCDLFKEKEEEIGKSFFEALEKMRNK